MMEKPKFIIPSDFLRQNMMGPNSTSILAELTANIPIRPGMRILDLGCGNGLTSICLAKWFNVQVFAVDLWISASDNLTRFRQMGVEDRVIPIHADAASLPFAEQYFDGIISVDAYHYFGNNSTFFPEKIRPLLKPDGFVALAFPSMKYHLLDNPPPEMMAYWDEEALSMWQSAGWWKDTLSPVLRDFRLWEMDCFEQAWLDWLNTENPYAIEDRKMMAADNGRFMNLIGITGRI